MTLAFPFVFLLLPLPLVIRLAFPARSVAAGLRVPAHVLDTVSATATGADRVTRFLLTFGWVALIMALADPQISRTSDILPASGRDIVLAIDLSGSMEKRDFVLDGAPTSRLDAVKRTAAAFVAAREGDRIGLVVFGERPYFAQPLTFDVKAVARAIEQAKIGISGRSTAISDGLGLATKRLVDSDASSRVVVLLSDGVDTSGKVKAVDAARLAAEHGLRIYTIALGPDDLESQPTARDAVDSRSLREMADVGGGQSFRVRTMDDLTAMAETLNALEPNPRDRPPLQYWQSLWPWPAAFALLALTLMAVRRQA